MIKELKMRKASPAEKLVDYVLSLQKEVVRTPEEIGSKIGIHPSSTKEFLRTVMEAREILLGFDRMIKTTDTGFVIQANKELDPVSRLVYLAKVMPNGAYRSHLHIAKVIGVPYGKNEYYQIIKKANDEIVAQGIAARFVAHRGHGYVLATGGAYSVASFGYLQRSYRASMKALRMISVSNGNLSDMDSEARDIISSFTKKLVGFQIDHGSRMNDIMKQIRKLK